MMRKAILIMLALLGGARAAAHAAAQAVGEAVAAARAHVSADRATSSFEPTLLTATEGGSLPGYCRDAALDRPILVLPVADHDYSRHDRDGKPRVRILGDVIDFRAALRAASGRA